MNTGPGGSGLNGARGGATEPIDPRAPRTGRARNGKSITISDIFTGLATFLGD